MLALAGGEVGEEEMADWFRTRSTERSDADA